MYLLPVLSLMISPIYGMDSIPPFIQRVYEEFKWEGLARGVDVTQANEGWELRFDKLTGLKAAKCQTRGKRVDITIDSSKWKRLDEFQRRGLLFHEFGHCFLNRRHRNEKLVSGECVSLMDGKEGGFYCSNNFYSPHWWSYYVDELFDPSINHPSWYASLSKPDWKLRPKIFFDSCVGSFNGLQKCFIKKNLSVRKDQGVFIELISPYDFWESTSSSCLQIDKIRFCIDPIKRIIFALNARTEFSFIDAYFFRIAEAHKFYKDLFGLSLLIENGWIYFFAGGRQVHLMDFQLPEQVVVASNGSKTGGRMIQVFIR